MYGPLSTVDPDAVENDVGAIWRELYKLEKHFGEEANPLSMAKKVLLPHVQYVLVYIHDTAPYAQMYCSHSVLVNM